ncbi:putative peptidoglycan binding domain protein [Marvinbryantia formatexigens DSM 14469]|uniref:Peptidoglycan binding domain protein n=1 Tax=Marvinbryantia formatexigens DSM 14469 TaxID=478749 RepID=C6LKS2_9FIRM|nr:peptidoglycan-binding protein [Marvinbryantia formatexigens]EET58809.1 putative peptidoglycan binding domain protein [Marvinbryantia formatexigens DSM 14469]UWO24148.1 peptidoglycan-binding protein [Marvinbryantia formatexigens DSM 14469]
MQQTTDTGMLRINVESALRSTPVEDAVIDISYSGDPENVIEEVRTDSSGRTETLSLEAPPLEYSLTPGEAQPYSEYTFSVSAEGYEKITVSGSEILSGQLSLQTIRLRPIEERETPDVVVIPAHTLYGNYPPKIAEAEVKPVSQTGEIVLSRVVVPEFVVVHDGSPRDTTATDYYVRYKDYIKNVASSEIYSTWPQAALRANILAIMSFTLNRVYTEWYRNKGFNFTITSSTAFDHKWIYGRNIYESISEVVDEIFDAYLSRPNVKQPILTQYCDGNRVICPNWMSQWGSKNLADQGYSDIEILRYYYGDSMYINTAEEVSGIPSSYPGYALRIGSSGDAVRQIQEQLNAISNNYPLIPKIAVDGIFGPATENAVKVFQSVFGLTQDGIVGRRTWYRIQDIYVAVTRIAELYP